MGDKGEYVPLASAVDASDDVEQHAPTQQPSTLRRVWQAWRVRLLLGVVLVQFVAIVLLLPRSSTKRRSPGSTHFLYCEHSPCSNHFNCADRLYPKHQEKKRSKTKSLSLELGLNTSLCTSNSQTRLMRLGRTCTIVSIFSC